MRLLAMGAMLMMSTGGCAAVPPEENEDIPVRGETGRKCDASKAQALLGDEGTKALAAKAMKLTGAGAVRWVRPGDMVTMDYREDRLNIHLDAKNRVTRIACG